MNWLDTGPLLPEWDASATRDFRFHKDREAAPPGWVFVFGSNLAGRHGLGAAALAAERYGAIAGKGVGRMGESYAIPTKDGRLAVLALRDIQCHVETFLAHARSHPTDRFWVTRVGCVLAGYSNSKIAPLFAEAPENCSFAVEWARFIAPSVKGCFVQK